MIGHRIVPCAALLACGAIAAMPVMHAQDPNPVVHAKRVIELLNREKFENVVAEFNPQMAAALSSAQLRAAWSNLGQQYGPFRSFVDQPSTTSTAGLTVIILGRQFERATVSATIAFDVEQRIAGLRFIRRAAVREHTTAPPSTRFREESVTIGTGEWTLPGTLSLPNGRIAAAVVLVHGSGASDRDETLGPNKPFQDIAWGLADRGIAVLRYDKRTFVHAKQLAAISNPTVREEVIEDALSAAAFMQGRKEIVPTRIFILGHSLGGTLAPRIAGEVRSLAGLIIMAGATRPLQDVAREQLAYLASIAPGSPSPEEGLQLLRRSAPESYWRDLDTYKPARVAATLRIPMLVLQGARDYQVTSADLQGWRDALGDRRDLTIKSYPTLNHLFMTGEGKSTPSEYERPGHVAEFVLDDIADWLRRR